MPKGSRTSESRRAKQWAEKIETEHSDGHYRGYLDGPMARLILPWPLSVNTYWRQQGGKDRHGKARPPRLSDKAKYYKQIVRKICDQAHIPRFTGRLAISVLLCPPYARKHDIDNYAGKSVFDALESAGVLVDDEQIDHMIARRGPKRTPGVAYVELREANVFEAQQACFALERMSEALGELEQ